MKLPLKILPFTLVLFLCLLFFAQVEMKAQGDITPPVVVSISIAPSVINTRDSDQVITVTARITDDLSGLDRFEMWVGPLSIGNNQDKYVRLDASNRVEGTAPDGTYTRGVTIPRYSAEGRWVAKYSVIYDVVGNQSSCRVNAENVCPDDWDSAYFDNVGSTDFVYLPAISVVLGE